MLLLLALLVAAAAQLGSPIELIDIALEATARLSGLSREEESAAVRLILSADYATLLLARHFGPLPTYESHLRHALRQPGSLPPLPQQPAPTAAAGAPMSAADALRSRRSVVAYNESRPVPEAVVRRALEAAVLAPNHFLTEPWRFYECGPATRAALAALNAAKAEAFARVPRWLVVTVAASEYGADGSISTKKGLEDYAATACAVQNFMLSLAAEGVGSKWMTGALGVPPEAVLAAVGADADKERLVGAIWYGFPATALSPAASAPARKRGLDGVLAQLP